MLNSPVTLNPLIRPYPNSREWPIDNSSTIKLMKLKTYNPFEREEFSSFDEFYLIGGQVCCGQQIHATVSRVNGSISDPARRLSR